MVRPLRIQYKGALYHVTNRGNDRKAIYKDDADRNMFLQILSQSIDTYGVNLHSFVLMKNHWHLLVDTPLGNLGEFMRHLNITYTSHYNRRHKRVGHLYQGRYKSFLVEKESYLSRVSRYIHLNPVRVRGFKKMSAEDKLAYLGGYKWSSFPGYCSQENKLDFVEYATVLDEYGGDNYSGRIAYQQQITEDLLSGLTIRDKIVGQSILGEGGFVSWVKETFLKKRKDRERPDIGKVHRYLSKDIVLDHLKNELGTESVLEAKGINKQIVMAILYKYAGLNNREIGVLLGVDYSTVSQGRKRLRDKVTKDQKTKMIFERIEFILSTSKNLPQ